MAPDQFGAFLIMNSIWFLVFFLEKGVFIELLYTQGREQHENNLNNFFLLQCIFGGTILLALLLLFPIVSAFELPVSSSDWLFFSVATCLLSWREFFRGVKIFQLIFIRLLIFDFFYTLLIGIFLALLYRSNNLTISYSWLVIIIAAGLLLVLCFILDGAKYKISFKNLRSMIQKQKSFMLWNGFVNAMVWSYANIYRFVLLLLLGPVYVASIGACNYLIRLSNPILNGVQNYYLVKISRAQGLNKCQARREASLIIMITVILFSMPLLIAPEWLMEFVFAGKYPGYGIFVQSYGVSLIITNIGRIFHIELLSSNKAKGLALAYIISLPLSMTVLLLSVKVLNVNGIIIYILASSSLFTIITYLVKKKTLSSQVIIK